jgi:predicted TIM-barrel fold metal-dependent hydrolase
VETLVMGSDYPHAEGLAEPAEFSALLPFLSQADLRRFMRDNAEEFFGPRLEP